MWVGQMLDDMRAKEAISRLWNPDRILQHVAATTFFRIPTPGLADLIRVNLVASLGQLPTPIAPRAAEVVHDAASVQTSGQHHLDVSLVALLGPLELGLCQSRQLINSGAICRKTLSILRLVERLASCRLLLRNPV